MTRRRGNRDKGPEALSRTCPPHRRPRLLAWPRRWLDAAAEHGHSAPGRTRSGASTTPWSTSSASPTTPRGSPPQPARRAAAPLRAAPAALRREAPGQLLALPRLGPGQGDQHPLGRLRRKPALLDSVLHRRRQHPHQVQPLTQLSDRSSRVASSCCLRSCSSRSVRSIYPSSSADRGRVLSRPKLRKSASASGSSITSASTSSLPRGRPRQLVVRRIVGDH